MTDGGRGERWKQTDHLGDLEEMFVAWAKAVTTGAVRNHSIDFEDRGSKLKKAPRYESLCSSRPEPGLKDLGNHNGKEAT